MATAAGAMQKYDKSELAAKWARLRNQLTNVKREAEETMRRIAVSGITLGSFGAMYFWRKLRVLKGQRVTFDKGGKVDAFLWPGLTLALVGATPFAGNAGPYVSALGIGTASAGMTGFLDELAQKQAAGG